MTRIFKLIFSITILILSSPAVSTKPPRSNKTRIPAPESPPKGQLGRQSYRDTLINMDTLLEKRILNIQPGMTVLDIGTGTGYNAYKFAEMLKGTGKVFATDIRTDRIKYAVKEAKRRGLSNLYPVPVKSDGVDEFYGKHRYDLIFLCNVYHRLTDRINYFKEMRNYLNEGGKLVVIICKSVFLFHIRDITDLNGLIDELSLELHINDPFYNGLRESTRESIRQLSWGRPDQLLKESIVEDFNRMLLDPHFYRNFLSQFFFETVSLSEAGKNFVDWLLMGLQEERAFDKAQQDLTPKQLRAIIKLNKLFFLQRFRKYLYNGNPGPRLATTAAHKQTSKFMVIRELKQVGYKLDHEYDQLPYHVILFFTTDNNRKEEIS